MCGYNYLFTQTPRPAGSQPAMEATNSADADSIFSFKGRRLPDDTVFYSIYPDFSLSLLPNSHHQQQQQQLQTLHLEILESLAPFTSLYIWQHQPFSLSPSLSSPLPHLHGHLRFGDNLDDEWFVVFLLRHVTFSFPHLSVRVRDSDGDFLLIEAALHLPKWLTPSSSPHRLFLRQGHLHLITKTPFPNTPTLIQSLNYLTKSGDSSKADDSIQNAINLRIRDYPDKAMKNMHRVRVRVPLEVAQVLRHEPCLVALAVEGFYDRDVDSMRHAAKMERFSGEIVRASVVMSRAMYAQLVQQGFQPPKGYPMPPRSDVAGYAEAEAGMKIAVGLEMLYQLRRREEGKGSTWEVFRESLDKSGYFRGLVPGSKDYRRLMENAEEYYRKSSLFSRASEILSAPVRRIDELLALPHSADDFETEQIPPSDDDSWLYNGEDELNAALLEREKELEAYNSKHKGKQKSNDPENPGPSFEKDDDFGLGDIAKSMQAFVQKMSSYEGAEVPKNRDLEDDVNFDVDRFMKDMESVMGRQGLEESGSDDDFEGGSSSDMDLDESEEETDVEPSEALEGEDNFMHSYSDVLNEELRSTTLNKSFVRAREQSSKRDEGTSNAKEAMDDEFTPVDVDVNLVKSFLDSFSSQEGLPGPATNLLGLMGLSLPPDKDVNKAK